MLFAAGADLIVPEPGTIIWALITFLFVVLILWRIWGKILGAIDQRAESIHADMNRAETARKEAEDLLHKYQKQMEEAKQEAQRIIEEGKGDANRVRESILQEARDESARLTEHAKREIHLAEQKAVSELMRKTVELATEAASRIIRKTLKAEDQKELLEEYVSRVEKEMSSTPVN